MPGSYSRDECRPRRQQAMDDELDRPSRDGLLELMYAVTYLFAGTHVHAAVGGYCTGELLEERGVLCAGQQRNLRYRGDSLGQVVDGALLDGLWLGQIGSRMSSRII